MEIPGLANENIYHIVRKIILEILQTCMQFRFQFCIFYQIDKTILIKTSKNYFRVIECALEQTF